MLLPEWTVALQVRAFHVLAETSTATAPAPVPGRVSPTSVPGVDGTTGVDPTAAFGPDWLAPILSTGVVGVIFLMVVFRIKLQPTYVLEDARSEWERERNDLVKNIDELKATIRDANSVYTTQVIPTLTRVLDAERELVDLRRDEQAERRRYGDPQPR